MTHAPYNDIAAWYDRYLQEQPVYEDVVLPALLSLLGSVQGQAICDLACGQGWLARELARRGARMTGIDLAEQQIVLARQYEEQEPLGISYSVDDVQVGASVVEGCFDGSICILALMDIPDIEAVFRTCRRILKPGGWFVFAITHPCFTAPDAQWMETADQQIVRAVRGYFQERFWRSTAGGIRTRVGAYHRMLSTYLNTLATAGFALERLVEPIATGKYAEQMPGYREVPSLAMIRASAIVLNNAVK
ncbi:class I SAM-dependent methyltransferase [Reticulibacter mediterranei]|uniref:Class I SAM-dependent methyltransferase n=1 Tax=Reticulibacter mediterranei TaxID=2778369 RepID=A0A8J3IJS8_9CHLR|nr:class I SAM-dependent methyltransferase [Reticulibacter mediterranei]GHO95801.1 class I SAM-dependent methyltransferase [Reticulibacter mediterranei]